VREKPLNSEPGVQLLKDIGFMINYIMRKMWLWGAALRSCHTMQRCQLLPENWISVQLILYEYFLKFDRYSHHLLGGTLGGVF
jgi:hypothetical protein